MRQAHGIADRSFNTHLTGDRIADAGHEASIHNLKNLSGNFSSNFHFRDHGRRRSWPEHPNPATSAGPLGKWSQYNEGVAN